MKKPRTAKAEAAEKPPKEPRAAKAKRATSNAIDPEKRELFLADLAAYQRALEKEKKAKEAVAAAKEAIKNDGFTLRQVKVSIQLSTPEGEAEYKMQVANDLLAAQYVGAAIGSQLSMFLEPDRTPAVDIAYDQGQKASMENRAAVPPYDPSTPQHAEYMKGFHDHQATILAKGITKLDKPSAAEMN